MITPLKGRSGMCSHNRVGVSVWKLIYCVTTTATKLEKIRAKLRVKCWRLNAQLSHGLGVAVQSLSLVVSLSNEALWSRGSRPSLGPHTSLMFPHHSADNYRGRECHLSHTSSTEDDSTRSVVCQTCHVRVASRTHSSHAHTLWVPPHTRKHTNFTQSEPYVSSYYTHNTWDAWLLWLCSSRLLNFFLIDTEKYLCVKTKG